MQCLKQNSVLYLCILFLSLGCTSTGYKIHKQVSPYKAEIIVAPERIVPQCEQISDENPDYMFMLNVLDENNTVLAVLQKHSIKKEDCFERVKKVSKIIKVGKRIKIGGTGELNEARTVNDDPHVFPNIGTFHWNGRVLELRYIANEQGQCFDAYYGNEKPCPRDGFPLK